MTWNLCVWQVFLMLLYLVQTDAYQDETDLRANLSSGYNRFVRPYTQTNVSIFYSIRALQELDITDQDITITGWMTLAWSDPRLVWDSSSNGITQMEINWGWRPEFIMGNPNDGVANYGIKDDDTRLRIYNSGVVQWMPVVLSKTSCDVDISKFPFDTQTCELEFIFWGYIVDELQLINLFSEVSQPSYMENAEWTLDRSSTTFSYVPFWFPNFSTIFKVELTFSRRQPYYVMNLIFPTVLLSVCMLWAFILPTESGERLGYALTILLAYTVQLSMTAEMMPTTSKQVPYIAQYLLMVLLMCTLVTSNVVIHVKLFHLAYPVYGWLKKVYRRVYPFVFFKCCSTKKTHRSDNQVDVIHINPDKSSIIPRKNASSDEEIPPGDFDEDTDQDEVTWAMVSVLLDRIFFYIYVIAMVTVNMVFLYSIA